MPSQITPTEDFIVSECKTTKKIIAILLLVVFFISLSVGSFGWENDYNLFVLFLLPAFFMFRKIISPKVEILKINVSGIYYNGQQIVWWENFIEAKISEEIKTGSINDHFFLYLKYHHHLLPEIKLRKIPLTNLFDKSEEEIMEAIRKFYNGYKKNRQQFNE